MFQRSDSSSHPDPFAVSNASLFMADSLRDAPYRSSIDDPLSHSGNGYPPQQYQSSTSFSSRNRHGSIGGGLSHTIGPLYHDANSSSYTTSSDLYPKAQSLLPTLSEGLSYDYDSSAPRNLVHQQPFGPIGLGGSAASGSSSLLSSSFGAVPNTSQPLLNGSNGGSTLHQPQMTQPHLLQHLPPSQQQNTNGLTNQYSIGGLHQSMPPNNPGIGTERMTSQLYSNPPSFSNPGPVPPNNNNNINTGTASSVNPTQANGQEEISTIFVVGFPDDMQEREFQNMFTFSHGFEAATLKIPNKESTSYGMQNVLGGGTANSSLRSGGMGSIIGPGFAAANGYAGASDPYNLVTVNSGGVVLDSRDLPGPTTTAAWPGLASDEGFMSRSVPAGGVASDQAIGIPSGPNAPPRKQIIGFAKFATRADAIVARDMLQSKRVDVEKGAVLKAEMAKKNLHTKRGVGPLGTVSGPGGSSMPGNSSGGGGIGHNMVSSLGPPNGFPSLQPPPGLIMTNGTSSTNSSTATPTANGDMGSFGLTQRERDSAAIAAMGLGGGPKNRQDVEREREYERDLEERDLDLHTRHNGVSLYDPFHPAKSISGSSASSSSAPRRSTIPDEFSNAATPTSSASLGAPSGSHSSVGAFNSRSAWAPEADERSSGSLSPSSSFSRPHGLAPGSEREREKDRERERYAMTDEGENTILASNQYSQSHSDSRPGSPVRLPTRPPSASQSRSTGSRTSPEHFVLRSFSPHPEETPSNETNSAWQVPNRSLHSKANPSSSSRGGSSSPPDGPFNPDISQNQSASRMNAEAALESGDGGSLEARMTEFSINSHRESSPQIPSPGSGGTGPSGRANAADQNPPINTLYVGNLPTTSAASTTNVLLEENLRLAFSRCPGYRKLCFRQKSNGPMCFVEFDDVSYATKALNDMYGHTLNGLIKNGIRLSYSKNPLGVRSPSLSNGSTGPAFGSGYHSLHDSGRFVPKSSVFGIEGAGRNRQDSVTDGRHSGLSAFGFDNPRSSRQASLATEYNGPVSEYVPSFANHSSSPPSRYFSPTPGGALSPSISHSKIMSSAFGGLGGSGSGYASGTSTFSPFGNELSQPSSMSQGDRCDNSLSSALQNYQLERSDGSSSLYSIPPGLGENRLHR